MRRFEDRVVLITGAARGQGRAHAVAFAREGASVAICDIAEDIASVPYELGREGDLAETAQLCESEGAGVLSDRVDVRDYDQVQGFVDRALERFGKIDIAVANAGIFGASPLAEMAPQMFTDMVDVNLRGVFHTLRAVLPSMLEREYGRLIATGSVCSLIGVPGVAHYVAAKHGVAGLVKSLAKEVGPRGITANYVCPNGVATKMVRNEAIYALMSPDDPTEEGALPGYAAMNAIPIPWIQPDDVSRVVLWLASDEGRFTTGSAVKVDLGATA